MRSARLCARQLLCLVRGFSSERTTTFGFRTVSEEEKAQEGARSIRELPSDFPLNSSLSSHFSVDDAVQSVFTNVSQSYDLMNDMMSFGLHHLWKDYLVKKLSPTPGSRLLDAAGGTGMRATLNSRISHSLCVGMKLSR